MASKMVNKLYTGSIIKSVKLVYSLQGDGYKKET